jgi:DNA-binding MarR family transcriptional regulator
VRAKTLTGTDWSLWHVWMEAQRLVVEDIDQALRSGADISKAEFSVLRTVDAAADATLRVVELADALRWDKSRVAHLLTRMEHRGLTTRVEGGASGRRTAVALSPDGRAALRAAERVHADSVRRLFTDRLSDDQAAVIRQWSEQIVAAASAQA